MSEPSEPWVSLATHPDPVLQYEFRDGVPTVSATNDAFDAAVGVDETAPLTAVFEQFETVASSGEEPPAAQLRAGDPVELVLESTTDRYVGHVLAPDTDGGTILFTRDDEGAPDGDTGAAQVTSAIVHDLRNPLDVAGAHLEAARETGEREHFDAVAAAHDRMERIIQEVLTLARGEAALSVDPGVAVRDTAERAWATVETDEWRLELDAALPTVKADADRLQRLFENLFRNSVEHGSTSSRAAPDDSVEHDTVGRRGDDDGAEGGTVRVGPLSGGTDGVFVADDGPGIPASERGAVLTPGYTVDGAGTGLGLAIVDRIAAAHGWTVSIAESERGGTRVEIRFTGA